ncbi:hypothetical protein NARC_50090 [Candidatus Nitrosocosmicus arcticus]|uniref:Uncharacterized protein n=1 Tax=Candidatus Nitrosocosmicus arcticus TaxID=2035267 RepID=A0A557SWD1_9ARCH|nr:hypothetical protein NARC_50090 [Candidatus Nitrosocosmicus arcticus]
MLFKPLTKFQQFICHTQLSNKQISPYVGLRNSLLVKLLNKIPKYCGSNLTKTIKL